MTYIRPLQRRLLLGAFALAFSLFALAGARAEDFPSRAITLVVWTSPGGPLDLSLRRLASLMEPHLGQPVVVENRPGGNSVVAMSYLRSRPADSYTLLSVTSSLSLASAKGEVPFKLSDFHFLRMMEAEASAIAVRKDSPLTTAGDFVKRMKENPNSLRIGGFAAGGFHQFAFFQMQRAGGYKATWIPFDSGREVSLALLGGHIDVAFMTPSSGLAQVLSGDIRLIGIAADDRSPSYPQVPTLKEQGYPISQALWRGVMMKAGAPAPVLAKIQDAIDKAAAAPEWKKVLADARQDPRNLRDGEFFAVVEGDVSEARKFLKDAGLVR